ncbi:TRP-domain-containing protein [Wilcoxina mikolae CBS 423.85]|nr:TRP-domain-containing protein [Wilcoxina mikolae CBS 423.85]
MKLHIAASLLGGFVALSSAASADILRSSSLATCMENSGFSATLFNVSFTPGDGQLRMRIKGSSKIVGTVRARLTVLAYGFSVMSQELDPCKTAGLGTMCPMKLEDNLDMNFQQTIDNATVSKIPVIAYRIPDLDGVARMEVIDTSHQVVACVEAPLSNGQTVQQPAVGWITGIISGLALTASAVASGLGHSSTAAHLAANALGLFGYFQAQAMIAMMAVHLPPLAAAWAQNFDWAMGIINIDFMQRIFHWYIQATNGKTATLLKQTEDVSVQIAKRSLESSKYLLTRAANYGFLETPPLVRRAISERSNNNAVSATSTKIIKVTGIERMSYMAGIESSNFFMTGMSFFVAFVCLVMLGVSAFRLLCTTGAFKNNGKFQDFRLKWLVVLKGIMYRIVLIGFPQMAILCPWELIHLDSPAAAALAAFFFVAMFATLGWAAYKILMIGQHSAAISGSRGPSYTLYSDPATLNRWGYLYVQFRADTYYYIVPLLLYILAKSLAIAFGQTGGIAQSIVVLVIETIYLAAVAYLRPWLDRRTNIVNIAIAVINFLNAILVVIFSGVTGAPDMVPGVLGVVFFIINAIFALVLLVILAIAVCFAIFSKNPEERYRGETPLPTSAEKTSNIRDLDADPLPPLHAIPPREIHSRGESERGAQSLRIHDDTQFKAPAPFPPHLGTYEPSTRAYEPSVTGSTRPSTRAYEPSVTESTRPPYGPSIAGSTRRLSVRSQYSQRSRGGGGGAGGGFVHPPSAQQHYGDRNYMPAGPNWNVGAGYERGGDQRGGYRAYPG